MDASTKTAKPVDEDLREQAVAELRKRRELVAHTPFRRP